MTDNSQDGASMARRREPKPQEHTAPGNGRGEENYLNGNGLNGHSRAPKLDAWVILDMLSQRWMWLVVGFLLGAAGLGYVGHKLIKPKFTAVAQLLRYETPGAREFFNTAQLSPETLAGMMRSPELLKKVGDMANPPIPPEKFVKLLKIEPQPDSDIVKLALASGNPEESVKLLNDYGDAAVEFTRNMQARQADLVASNYLKQQLVQMDQDLNALRDQFRDRPGSADLNRKVANASQEVNAASKTLANGASPASSAAWSDRLDKALGELAELSSKYTDIHPAVIQKSNEVASLQSRLSALGINAKIRPGPASPLARDGDRADPESDIIRMKLLSLEEGRVSLTTRQREAAAYAADPPGIVRVFAPATLQTVATNFRQVKIGFAAIFGGCLGMAMSLVLLVGVEFMSHRMKTVDDLRRVSGLPVLTTLGNLNKMTAADQAQWAFRTWMILQGKLSKSPNHGLVCGVTSASEGEGRSTWISLLSEAASMAGFRVLTIATRPSPAPEAIGDSPDVEGTLTDEVAKGLLAAGGNSSLTSTVLMQPAQVTEQLAGSNLQPVVHIPLPGWVWNLERRRQWRDALNQWRMIDNLVILVELPPAIVPEAVLLGSNLPNLLWLSDSSTADAAATRSLLETLRHARCNLVGAVLNREPRQSLKKRFPRWVECTPLFIAAALFVSGLNLSAQVTNAVSVEAPISERTPSETPREGTFSIVNPSQRAAWQRRLTLGPGDVVNLGLYGEPAMVRTEVAVGPDGRISFLEAQDVMATGLTIDELRTRLDQEVGQYRRAARTIITPVAFRSKRYYVLGKVLTKGVYVLDRPITVLEAIARAHGVENGLLDRNLIDIADFSRSILVRGGHRVSLSFERLFQDGDLSQNVAIEPGDYLYLPGADTKEVYVVGEVRLPGATTYTPNMTIMAAIAARGGYSERAYKKRVLVVRGSVEHPETFAVDTHAVLDGEALNFVLKPKDIVFVNSRPFIRVEELADLAATAFIQSLITTWVGVDVVKPINQ